MTVPAENSDGEVEDRSLETPLFALNTAEVIFFNGTRSEWKGIPSQFPL
jgi:hypothetical protein